MSKGMKHLFYDVRQRELGSLSLERRRLQEDLIAAFQYLKGAYRKAGTFSGSVGIGQGVMVLD